MPADQVKGVMGGTVADARPAGGPQVELLHLAEAGAGQGHIHQPHRVAPVVAVGTRHSGGRDGQVTAQHPSGALRHGLGHLGGDGAELVQQLLGHTQDPVLDGVGVAHHAALEDGGGPGQIGDTLGDEAAGTALGGAEGETFVFEKLEDGRLQVFYVGALDQGAEEGPDIGLNGGNEGVCRLFGGGVGGDAQLAFPLLGIGGQGGIAHTVHLFPEPGLHG